MPKPESQPRRHTAQDSPPPGFWPEGVRSAFVGRQPAGWHTVPTTDPGLQGFNLGERVGDDPARVAAHRTELAQQLGAQPGWLHQVHGVAVVQAVGEDAGEDVAGPPPEADACLTHQAGLACTAQVADCLPVLWAGADGRWVAASHAGWRGLAAGVLEATARRLLEAGGYHPADLRVWLGPCIGPQAFQVGPEVRAAFVDAAPEAAACFTPDGTAPGRWLADLAGLAHQRLSALGVVHRAGNNSSRPWCTVSDESRFFSHRRDGFRLGRSGRMVAAIWRLSPG